MMTLGDVERYVTFLLAGWDLKQGSVSKSPFRRYCLCESICRHAQGTLLTP